MPSNSDYVCSQCGAEPGRERLTVKKVVFLEIGSGGRTLRSRTLDWLCQTCLKGDADYNREKHNAPGTTNWKGRQNVQRVSTQSQEQGTG